MYKKNSVGRKYQGQHFSLEIHRILRTSSKATY